MFPKIGHRPIDKLLAPEVIIVLKPLAAKGSLETISKIIGHINEVMRYAVNTGLLHHNSLAGIRSAFETPKVTHLATLKPEELPELMKAINYASIKLTTRCLIEWQLHTMVRPREAAEAKWCEIDFEKSLWVIPPERMKMKVEHSVPLSPQALTILEIIKPVSVHREFIFPADRHPNKSSNAQTANKALSRMGFKGRLGFKNNLLTQTSLKTGDKLSKSTINGTCNHLKVFFQWLAQQTGYKSRFNYTDADYFNLSEKDTRIAGAKRK